MNIKNLAMLGVYRGRDLAYLCCALKHNNIKNFKVYALDDFDDVSDQTIKEIDDELGIKKGFYKGGLTDTTQPKRGPMSQGIAEAYQNL